MLFITNRTPAESSRSEVGRLISFPAENNDVSQSVYYCRRRAKNKYYEIGSESFMSNLRDSRAKQVLFFIHGAFSFPEDGIFGKVHRLQQMFDRVSPNLVSVVSLVWPCDTGGGIIHDFWDDQKAADQSGFAFARVLQKFLAWRSGPKSEQCTKRINVLAHSMGARVLRETLKAWNKYDLSRGLPLLFRNTFLVAADLVNETLETGQSGVLISDASRNVVVYHASDDFALRASKLANLRYAIASRRLGHSGPEDMSKVRQNVYAVDCDDVNDVYDSPTGHTYFLRDNSEQPGKVFEHMQSCLQSGRVAWPPGGGRCLVLSE